jgi:UDP-glucose 6-dehydrogenase
MWALPGLFAESGNDVVCVDIMRKIAMLKEVRCRL